MGSAFALWSHLWCGEGVKGVRMGTRGGKISSRCGTLGRQRGLARCWILHQEAVSVSLRAEGLQALDEGSARRSSPLCSVLKVCLSDNQVEPPSSSQMLRPGAELLQEAFQAALGPGAPSI